MIMYYDYHNFNHEARSRVMHVSQTSLYLTDLKDKYANNEDVASKVKVVIQLFKNIDYSTLANERNDHETTTNLRGYRSPHLFRGTERDVAAVHKKHRLDIVFHRIGNLAWAYDPDYESMDKERQMSKRKQKSK